MLLISKTQRAKGPKNLKETSAIEVDDDEGETDSEDKQEDVQTRPLPPPIAPKMSPRRQKKSSTMTSDAFHIKTHGFVLHRFDDESGPFDPFQRHVMLEDFGKETFGDKDFVFDKKQMTSTVLPVYDCTEYFTCHSPADPACWDSCVVLKVMFIEGLSIEYIRSTTTFRELIDASKLPSNKEVEYAIVSIMPETNVYREDLHVGDIVAVLPSTLHRIFLRPGYAQTSDTRAFVEVVCGMKGKNQPGLIYLEQYPPTIKTPHIPVIFPAERFHANMEFFALQACFRVPNVGDGEVECDVDMEGLFSKRQKQMDEDELAACMDADASFVKFEGVENTRKWILEHTRLGYDTILRDQSLWTLIDWIKESRKQPENFFYERQLLGDVTFPRPAFDDSLRLLGIIFNRPLPEIRSQDHMTLVRYLAIFRGCSLTFMNSLKWKRGLPSRRLKV